MRKVVNVDGYEQDKTDRLRLERRSIGGKRLLVALAVALLLHAGVLLLMLQFPPPPPPAQPPEHIEVTTITLPRPEPRSSPARSKATPDPEARPRPAPRPALRVEPSAEPPEPVAPPAPPPPRVAQPAPPAPEEPLVPRPPPPPAPATITNRDGSWVRHPDGSETLRNPALARRVPGATVDESVRVDRRGRIRDGRNSARNTEKRVASLLPRPGGRSPRGVDLGKFGWHALRQGANCGIYTGNGEQPAPDGVYILIDSSGSMERNLYTSPATTCGYSVALSAIEASEKTRVGVINFSSMHHVVPETRDLGRIADGITRAVGGATILPAGRLKDYVAPGGRKDIVVISDSHIINHRSALPYFQDVLERDPRNQGLLIVIGEDRMADASVIRQFIRAGFKVRHHSPFDLNAPPADRRPKPRPYRFTL